jgi:hypothetical protein
MRSYREYIKEILEESELITDSRYKEYEYSYCCINPKSNKELDFIIDNMKEITSEQFCTVINFKDAIQAVKQGVGISYDWNPQMIKTDRSNKFFKINKNGIDAYILVNSGVDHIFKNINAKTKEKKPKFKRTGNIKEFGEFKIGDILPKSGFKILDIITHDSEQTQFYLKTNNGNYWYDSKRILDYEKD